LAAARTAFFAMALAGYMTGAGAAETLHKVLASPLVDEGSPPDGCTPAVNGLGGPSRWQVRVERLLLDGKGLVEVSRQADANRFPLCIADLPVEKNAEVELPFVTRDGGIARAAGIVLRFADPQDFYVAEADALEGRVRLLRIVNGERRQIAATSAPLMLGMAHRLKVRAVDNDFDVALDGKNLFDAHDSGLASAGHFGVWSRADSLTVFGDLFITRLD
jgi:hypothetical protein